MRNPVRRLTIHGMLLQVPYWFGCCTYFAFMVTTLVDHGWTGSAAAGAITAMAVIGMLTQPVYGYISDKLHSEKILSVILLVTASACFLLLPLSLASGSRPLVLVNMTGITVTAAQAGGLIDAWIVGLKQEYPSINYGVIRGTGSLAFALSAQISGAVTIAFGHHMRMWVGGGSLILAVFVALTFRPARRSRQEGAGEGPARLGGMEAFRLVFSSKRYKLLMGVAFCLLLANMSMLTLNQLIIPELGGTAAKIGTATAVMAGSEVPFMFIMAFILKKAGFKRLFIFCSAVYVIRMFVTASVGTVNGLIYAQLMQGLTFAVLVPVSMSYLSKILDERVRSTAVTTYSAVTASLTGILSNLITSALLASGFSAQTALSVFAFSALAGFSLTLYGAIRKVW